MVQSPSTGVTLEEFLNLPETKPASEYINGQIVRKPTLQGKHSTIKTEFSATVNAILKPRKIARAFAELRCTFGGRSLVPNFSIWTWNRIPRDSNGEIADRFLIAPDWTIEILSPEQSQTKVTKNILHCLNCGSQMGWPIDPQERTVFVYLPGRQPEVFDEPEQLLPLPDFADDLSLSLGSIFDGFLE